MDKVSVTLNVFFEDPYWVGVVERIESGKLSACKITFGAEPGEGEIYGYLLQNYDRFRFSPAVTAVIKEAGRNPKRIQRKARRLVQNTGIGTRAQQALKLQQEQMKMERKSVSREQRDLEKQRQFDQKQQKKKEKHRGR